VSGLLQAGSRRLSFEGDRHEHREARSVVALILAVVALVGPTLGVPFPVLAVAVMLLAMAQLACDETRELPMFAAEDGASPTQDRTVGLHRSRTFVERFAYRDGRRTTRRRDLGSARGCSMD